jgi:hypothetical protein
MRDTPIRVYSTAEVPLRIVPSPLQPVIAGGIQRNVNRKEILIMDGSLSYDPDFPDDGSLRYIFCKTC